MTPARRLLAAGAALVLTGAGAPPTALLPAPRRIMSMNQCTDMLLLELVPHERIASVTYLARTVAPAAARGAPVNHGSAEEIVAQKPDVILAGDFSTPMTRRLAARVGARLVEVKSAASFQDIRDVTRQVGAAVGKPGRAEALIAEMDRKLAALDARRLARAVTVAAWSDGAVPGRRTLADEIIRRAGGINVAARLDDARYSSFGVEELLRADPQALLSGRGYTDRPALRRLGQEHPLVRRRWAGRTLTYPEALFSCGVPASADAALELQAGLTRLQNSAHPRGCGDPGLRPESCGLAQKTSLGPRMRGDEGGKE